MKVTFTHSRLTLFQTQLTYLTKFTRGSLRKESTGVLTRGILTRIRRESMHKFSTGLSFLSSAYGDTDEDNDSDDSNHEEEGLPSGGIDIPKPTDIPICQNERLPVPDALRGMFPSNLVEDEKEEHNGRVRSFPHARGNWASFIYINYSENPGLKWIVGCIEDQVKCQDSQSPPTALHTETDFHLSLSKTQVFKHHWIQPFINSYAAKCKAFKQIEICLDSVKVYVNEERSRTFVSVEAFPSDGLFRLVSASDECLHDFDLLPYYDPPSFHVTFAWMLGDQEQWISHHLLPQLRLRWHNACKEDPSLRKSVIRSIQFRTGNKTYTFPLQASLKL